MGKCPFVTATLSRNGFLRVYTHKDAGMLKVISIGFTRKECKWLRDAINAQIARDKKGGGE